MTDTTQMPESGPTPAIVDGAIYDSAGAAQVMHVTERFLQNDRVTKRIIPFVKIGRFVRYRGIDLRKTIEENVIGGGVA